MSARSWIYNCWPKNQRIPCRVWLIKFKTKRKQIDVHWESGRLRLKRTKSRWKMFQQRNIFRYSSLPVQLMRLLSICKHGSLKHLNRLLTDFVVKNVHSKHYQKTVNWICYFLPTSISRNHLPFSTFPGGTLNLLLFCILNTIKNSHTNLFLLINIFFYWTKVVLRLSVS
jgi:hypothetical protein